MKPIIEIRDLSKKYRLQQAGRYLALRDILTNAVRNAFKSSEEKQTDFWALKDLNLDFYPGDRVGLIGNNGAGKTTLLKILSRITPPTTGSATMHGNLSSLLEVGTGFHPELTGKENIYMNGSILGLKKTAIDRQFDAIVDFSGVAAFLDMPLKNYSSGMQLRLAFAVAAHLQPDILLIDEVLAVGDIEFQKKCIGKMQEVSNEDGRVILFVSHNMNYVSTLCNKAVLLTKGKVTETGTASEVIGKYVTEISERSASYMWDKNQPGNDIVKLHSLRIIDNALQTRDSFSVNERIGIEMRYHVEKAGHVLWVGHNIFNREGVNVFDTHNVKSEYYTRPHDAGDYSAIVWIPGNLLNTGTYFVGSAIFNHLEGVIHFHEKEVLLFNVHDVFDEVTARGKSDMEFPGIVRPLLDWTITKSRV